MCFDIRSKSSCFRCQELKIKTFKNNAHEKNTCKHEYVKLLHKVVSGKIKFVSREKTHSSDSRTNCADLESHSFCMRADLRGGLLYRCSN